MSIETLNQESAATFRAKLNENFKEIGRVFYNSLALENEVPTVTLDGGTAQSVANPYGSGNALLFPDVTNTNFSVLYPFEFFMPNKMKNSLIGRTLKFVVTVKFSRDVGYTFAKGFRAHDATGAFTDISAGNITEEVLSGSELRYTFSRVVAETDVSFTAFFQWQTQFISGGDLTMGISQSVYYFETDNLEDNYREGVQLVIDKYLGGEVEKTVIGFSDTTNGLSDAVTDSKISTSTNLEVPSDSIITRINVVTSSSGTLGFVLGKLEGTTFVVRKKLQPVPVGSGINQIDVFENVAKGEIIGVIGGSCSQLFKFLNGITLKQYNVDGSQIQTVANYAYLLTYEAVSFNTINSLLKVNELGDQMRRLAAGEFGEDETSGTTNFDNNTGVIAGNGYYGNSESKDYDRTIAFISINCETAGTVTFTTGVLDQNDYYVEETSFTKSVVIGVNKFAVDILLKANYILAVKAPTVSLRYDAVANGGNYFSSTGYGGVVDRIITRDLSLKIESKEIKQSVFAKRESVEMLETRVNSLEELRPILLRSGDGTLFKIDVSNAGALTAAAYGFTKMLVLGNSITIHPITSFWWGEWGMAASTRENDYVHKLAGLLQEFSPALTFDAYNIAAWEQNHASYDKSAFDSYFTGQDLVVVNVGENVSDQTGYEASYLALINYIKTNAPGATILCGGSFWKADDKDQKMQAAALSAGALFVSKSHLDKNENKSFLGAQVFGDDAAFHTVDNPGVAAHPGDLGMERIAQVLFSKLF